MFFLFVFVLLLFCFVLFCFVLFCFVLFCFVLFCFVLFLFLCVVLLCCHFFFLIAAFEECSYFSYYKDTQQCIVKSSRAAVLQGTVTNIDSGSFANSYSRPTACSQQEANTDYYMQSNLGSASSVCYKEKKEKPERKERKREERTERRILIFTYSRAPVNVVASAHKCQDATTGPSPLARAGLSRMSERRGALQGN